MITYNPVFSLGAWICQSIDAHGIKNSILHLNFHSAVFLSQIHQIQFFNISCEKYPNEIFIPGTHGDLFIVSHKSTKLIKHGK